jgi:Lrp/AsnC family transcriptional regulator, leucine-responsive regulatory protein
MYDKRLLAHVACKQRDTIHEMSKKRAKFEPDTHEMRGPAIDELDTAIIRVLQRKARATNDEVGESVGLSASAASRRILALESRGIIIGYQAIIESKAIGADITVFVRVTLERQAANALQTFELAVRRCHSVASCHLMAGEYDYMLQVKVASMADYERLHQQELSRMPGVSRLESNFAVRDVIERDINI